MKLTRGAEYGIRCLLYLSGQPDGRVVPRDEIAAEMDVPKQFLSKIAQTLSKAGFIRITQGPKGGYRLLREPARISLLQAIEAVDGAIVLNDCLIGSDLCQRSPHCPVHLVWNKARADLRRTLAETDFAVLAAQEALIQGCLCGLDRSITNEKQRPDNETTTKRQ